MEIQIYQEKVIVDGIVYKRIDKDSEKVGRQFIANYLGCSPANLSKRPFPDFGEALRGDRKPYSKQDVIEWLAKPLKTRKQLYKEWKYEVDKQDGSASTIGELGTGTGE